MQITPLIFSAIQFLNEPYHWGGNGPWGLDCSGLILKSFRDLGCKKKDGTAIPDMTAQDIFGSLQKGGLGPFGITGINAEEVEHDCLIFYGKNLSSITHIALAISPTHIIEAGGAGSNSLEMGLEELAKADARVRIRPIHHRKDYLAAVKVTY